MNEVKEYLINLITDKSRLITKQAHVVSPRFYKRPTVPLRTIALHHENSASDAMGFLSKVLTYSFGLLRYTPNDPWKIHRGFPSARCFYPTECYVLSLSDDDPEVPAGIYHYDPLEHQLEMLGSLCSSPSNSVKYGYGPSLSFVLTSEFWRLGAAYGDFAYNLCLLEAGHAVEQLLTLCKSLGMATKVYYRFPNRKVAESLRVPSEEESPLVAIEVGDMMTDIEVVLAGFNDAHLPETLWEQSRGIRNGGCPLLQQAESLVVDEPFAGRVEFPDSRWQWGDLTQITYNRNSGRGIYGIVGNSKPTDLRDVVDIGEYAALVNIFQEHFGLSLYCLVIGDNKVSLGKIGAPGKGWVGRGECTPWEVQAAFQYPFVNVTTMSAVYVVAACFSDVVDKLDVRAYRQQTMEAGRIAQRLCLAASERSFSARPVRSFDEKMIASLLHLDEGEEPLYYVILGTSNFSDVQADLRTRGGGE